LGLWDETECKEYSQFIKDLAMWEAMFLADDIS